ncbi:MAG TPA: WD40 repeat domain-containing protein [Chthoniobacteraceae bacterium]|jgi:WD40 repeat protein|nr:WD40 repeat domain-containing protein [Chthoniobacteraceae bacterium]
MHLLLCLWLFACGTALAAPVTALVYSPDGAALVAAAGESVLLRAPATGDALDAIPCAGMRVATLAFSPDGTLLAVGGGTPGEKGEVRLLDWPARKWLASMAEQHDLITGVAFSPDGQRLATACADNTARIHAIEDHGRRLAGPLVLTGHSSPVQAVAFSPDGKLLVTASMDRSLRVWSAADGKLLRSLGQHADAVQCVAFRPHVTGEPQCATAGDDRTVRIWQPGIGRMMRIVRGHEGGILALAFAPDGQSLFSAGQEGIVRQIDADSDAVTSQWRASSEWIHSLAISPDGRYLATGDWAGDIAVKALR